MSEEKLLDAFGQIEEEFIEDAAPENKPPKKKVIKSTWVKWGVMAASVLVIVGIGAPLIMNHDGSSADAKLEESQLEAEENEGAIAAEHVELRIHIENLNSDGFSGSIVYGTGVFKEGEQVDVVFLGHAYVVCSDGQIIEYDEESSNIGELELAVGNDVDVWFHAELYERAKDGSLSVYAYRIEDDNDPNHSEITRNEAGEGETNLVTMTHMEEIKIKIDEMFPNGFRGTIEVGTDLFKEGEQITIVAQDNVTVVQQDGSIFDYDELEPNIKDSDLAVGNSVWVGFQKYDYVEGNGKYNQIFAYHVEVGETRENNGANYGEGEVSEQAKAVTVNEITEPLALMLPMLSEDNRTAMTSEELYDYYGVNISSALGRIGDFEEREGSYPKGLYGYADGSIFDLNQFVFYESKSDYTLSVSIGKKTKCSMLIDNQDADAKSSEINGIDMQIYKLKDGAEKEYYATFAFGDCDFIIFGQNLDEDVFIKVLGSITK